MYAQHGDLLLKPIPKIPDGAERLKTLTLLTGSNNHDHKFQDGSPVILFKHEGVTYADVGEPSQLVHDEHKPITVPAGAYVMDQVREHDYDTDEMKRVVD